MPIDVDLLRNSLKELNLSDTVIGEVITKSSVLEMEDLHAIGGLVQEDFIEMEGSSKDDSLFSEYHSPHEEFSYVYEKLFKEKPSEEALNNYFRLSESSKESSKDLGKDDMSLQQESDIQSDYTALSAKVERFKKAYKSIYGAEISKKITDDNINDVFKLLENRRTFAGLTSEMQNTVLDNVRRSKRLAGVKIPEQKIRGSLSTYAKHSMGGFDYALRVDERGNERMYVSEYAEITRPIKVTGNLGQIAGDHVVPFSLFTRHIQNEVKGKEIRHAIASLRDLSAYIGCSQDLIDKAYTYTTESFSEARSFSFLKSELIPSMLAQWNQNEIAAFKAHDSASRDSQEGVRVKNYLTSRFNFVGGSKEKIKAFVNVIDYKPITETSGAGDLITGERTNDITTLASVIGSVITTYDYMYGINNNEAIIIVNEMLQQHGWDNYYQEQNVSDSKSDITGIIIQEITDQYPLLHDILTYIDDSSNLVRSEKEALSEVKSERQFMNILTKDLTAEETIILQDIKGGSAESVSISSRSGSSSVSNPFVTLIPEDNHQVNHKQNVMQLSKMLDDGEIEQNTVICLERKEGGNNFGMNDVKLLAAILRHNDKNEQPLPIAKSIKSSAI